MSKARILVIEDDEDIAELVKYNLDRKGYETAVAFNGEDGLKRMREDEVDLLILDLMLPGISGLEVCRILKDSPATSATPVVILSAKGEESDVVRGLETGADDYVAKPFSPAVLLARVKAVLRRNESAPPDEDAVLKTGELTIHPGRHEVLVGDRKTPLTPTEFRILYLLARRPGWVFTRSQIVSGVHGDDYGVTDRSIDVQVVGLRRKLGAAGDCVETVRGVGYRFRE